MSGLENYSSDDLAAELASRARQPSEKEYKPLPQCDECAHFVFWREERNAPEDYNPCAQGHRMSFKLPEGASDMDWGFYRRGCKDRTPAPGAQSIVAETENGQ